MTTIPRPLQEGTSLQAIGYIRCALKNTEQADQQRSEIEGYCKRKGWRLAAIYEDNGASGRTLERPGLQQALSALKPESVLIVTAPDRLSKSMKGVGVLLDKLEQAGARLVCSRQDLRLVERFSSPWKARARKRSRQP